MIMANRAIALGSIATAGAIGAGLLANWLTATFQEIYWVLSGTL
jgi:hypothetical protein